MSIKLPKFETGAEYRAFVEGAGAVIQVLLERAAKTWVMGRDAMDLDYLRTYLIDLQVEIAPLLRAASDLDGRGVS